MPHIGLSHIRNIIGIIKERQHKTFCQIRLRQFAHQAVIAFVEMHKTNTMPRIFDNFENARLIALATEIVAPMSPKAVRWLPD